MTDNEIIKALAKCSNSSNGCSGCPLFSSAWDDYGKSIAKCEGELICYAFEIINRQKAELDDLREIVYMDRTDAIKNLKVEAIKEFAERLKDIFVTINGTFECWEVEEHIDSLVKEMSGEE